MLEKNNIQPGTNWRFLVYDEVKESPDTPQPHHITSYPQEYSDLVLPNTVFDELVVDKWLHIEQMDDDLWWMNVGGVVLWVTIGEDGQPRVVRVVHPDEHAGPTPGCYYDINGVVIGEYPEGLSYEEYEEESTYSPEFSTTLQPGHDHPICPNCNTEMCGGLIRETIQGGPYTEQEIVDFYGGEKCYSNIIGIEDELMDHILFWRFPCCDSTYDRWTGRKVENLPKS